jgi:hypothetical protein
MLCSSIPAEPRFALTRFQASNTMRFDIANDFVDVIGSSRLLDG